MASRFKDALLVLVGSAMISLLAFVFNADTGEFGVLEMLQVAVLFVCLAGWLVIKQKHCSRNDPFQLPFQPIFAEFFALLMFIVLGRELSWLHVLGVDKDLSDTIEQIAIIFCLLELASLSYRWFIKTKDKALKLKTFLTSVPFRYALIALVFVVSGDIFEKELISTPNFQHYEESLELTGYLFMLLAITAAWRSAKTERI